jgi:hypothetical protein
LSFRWSRTGSGVKAATREARAKMVAVIAMDFIVVVRGVGV